VVEAIGVERSRHALTTSALLIVVLDRSQPLTDADRQVLDLVDQRLDPAGVVYVLNKADLPARLDTDELPLPPGAPLVTLSTVTGAGMDELKHTLHDVAVGQSEAATRPALVTARQFDALRRAQEHAMAALEAREMGVPLDLLAVDVRAALYAVGEITGEI